MDERISESACAPADRKRAQYEAASRYGARGSGGGSYGRPSGAYGSGQTYGSTHNVNTDWARSSYSHGSNGGYARPCE